MHAYGGQAISGPPGIDKAGNTPSSLELGNAESVSATGIHPVIAIDIIAGHTKMGNRTCAETQAAHLDPMDSSMAYKFSDAY